MIWCYLVCIRLMSSFNLSISSLVNCHTSSTKSSLKALRGCPQAELLLASCYTHRFQIWGTSHNYNAGSSDSAMTPDILQNEYVYKVPGSDNYYRPSTKLREGNVFTDVCHSVHRDGSQTLPDAYPLAVDSSGTLIWWRPPKWAVCILLECILVISDLCTSKPVKI